MSGATGAAAAPGITGAAYAFPAVSRSVRELAGLGQLHSTPDALESLGFSQVHVATTESPYELALRAACTLLEQYDVAPDSVQLLIYGGLSGAAAFDAAHAPPHAPRPMARYSYPATRL